MADFPAADILLLLSSILDDGQSVRNYHRTPDHSLIIDQLVEKAKVVDILRVGFMIGFMEFSAKED